MDKRKKESLKANANYMPVPGLNRMHELPGILIFLLSFHASGQQGISDWYRNKLEKRKVCL